MEFTLLTAVLVLEGIYEKGEEGQRKCSVNNVRKG